MYIKADTRTSRGQGGVRVQYIKEDGEKTLISTITIIHHI